MAEIHPEVKKSTDLLSEYAGARSKWANQAQEDNEFRNGKQWKKKHVQILRNRNQEPIVVNVIHSAVEQAKAMLTTNKPRFQTTAREGSDVKTGAIMSDLMSWVWDQSTGNSQLKEAIDDYYVKGMGVLQVYVDPNADYGKGEVLIKAIDPLDVYFDPNCTNRFGKDAKSVIVAKKIMRSQMIDSYHDYADIILRANATNYISAPTATRFGLLDEQVSSSEARQQPRDPKVDEELEIIERYTKIKQPYWKTYDPYANDERILSSDKLKEYRDQPAFFVKREGDAYAELVTGRDQVAAITKTAEEHGYIYHQEKLPNGKLQIKGGFGGNNKDRVKGSRVELTPRTIGAMIDEGYIKVVSIYVTNIECVLSVGDEFLYKIVKPIEQFPIIPLMNGFNRNPFPVSDVRLVRGLQEYINKIRSLIVAHASSSTNVKLLIPRGSMNKAQLEEEWGKAGTAVIEFDPELGQPIVAGPVPLPNELYKNEETARQDIERILGIYALMQGDQGSAPSTYKGTVALDEFGQRRIRSKQDDVEAMLNEVGKVVLQWVQKIYSSEKVIRLLQPNHSPEETTLNKDIYDKVTGEFLYRINDITVGKYDLIVVSGSTLPTNRWARFEYYMELLKAGVIDGQEVLKQTDVADIEGVMARQDQVQQLQGQLQGVQGQLQKTQGDLQTAERASVNDRKRVEVMQFEMKLAKAEAKAEMAASLYQSRALDQLSELKQSVRKVSKGSESNKLDSIVGLEE